MSIVITAMTKDLVIVASDSKMTLQHEGERVPKIYQYKQTLTMYGVGNAGILFGYFSMLNNIKSDIGNKFTYHDAIDSIHYWKDFIESTPEYKGIFGAVGVCGIVDNQPESTTILIDSDNYSKFENRLTPTESLSFYILPPSDLNNEICNDCFKENCQYIHKPLTSQILIDLCSKVIQNLSLHSSVINNYVQYWTYDLKSHHAKSQLIDFLLSSDS